MSLLQSRDFVAVLFGRSCDTTAASLYETIRADPSSFINCTSNIPIAAKHVVRALSAWDMFTASDAATSARIHLMSYAMATSTKGNLTRYRQQMLVADALVVPFSQHSLTGDTGAMKAGSDWYKEFALTLALVATHRARMMPWTSAAAAAAPLHIVLVNGGPEDVAPPAALLEAVERLPGNDGGALARVVVANGIKAAIATLQELALKQTAAVAAAATGSSLRIASFGSTGRISKADGVRSCIGRVTSDGPVTVALGSTLVTHDVASLAATAVVEELRVVSALALEDRGAHPFNECVQRIQNGATASAAAPRTVTVMPGDVVYMLLSLPMLRSRHNGEEVLGAFSESQLMMLGISKEKGGTWAMPGGKELEYAASGARPVVFTDITEPDYKKQMLAPALLFVDIEDHPCVDKLLTKIEREVNIIGAGNCVARVLEVDTSSTPKAAVLACFHQHSTPNETDGQLWMPFCPSTDPASTALSLVVRVADSQGVFDGVVRVRAALRQTEITHALLDKALQVKAAGANATATFMNELCNDLLCASTTNRSAFHFKGWRLVAPAAPAPAAGPAPAAASAADKTRKIPVSQTLAFLRELVATDTTALFCFARSADVKAVCRPHAAAGLVDIEDCGIAMRSFISLATSLRDRAAQASCIAVLKNVFLAPLSGAKDSLFDSRMQQRRTQLTFWPAFFQDMIEKYNPHHVLLVAAGHCCTNSVSFLEMGIPALLGHGNALEEPRAALRCAHFAHKGAGGAAPQIPCFFNLGNDHQLPSDNEHISHGHRIISGGRRPLVEEGNAQVVTRAALAVRVVGTPNIWRDPNLGAFLHAPSLAPLCRKGNSTAPLHQMQIPMQHGIIAWAERWASAIPGDGNSRFRYTLPANVVLFFRGLLQAALKREALREAGAADTPLEPVLELSVGDWMNVFTFVAGAQ